MAAIQVGVRLAQRYDAEILFHSGLPRYRPPAFDLPECAVAAQWDSLDDARDQADLALAQAQATAEKMGVMSTTAIGRMSRMFSMGTRLWPPDSTRACPSYSSSIRTACATESGRR